MRNPYTRAVQAVRRGATIGPLALAGFGLAVAGTTSAVATTEAVLEHGDLAAYDPAVSQAVIDGRSAWLTPLAQVLTVLGSTAFLLPATIAAVVLLATRRRWKASIVIGVGMTLPLLLTSVLKSGIGRIRPPTADLLGPINSGFAFPSGHTLNSSVFFGLLALVLIPAIRPGWARVAALLSAIGLAFGVGWSRVYLGYHWLTDVVGGWSIAFIIIGAALVVTATLWSPRRTT